MAPEMRRALLLYTFLLAAFGAAIAGALHVGRGLERGRAAGPAAAAPVALASDSAAFSPDGPGVGASGAASSPSSAPDPGGVEGRLGRLLLQMIVVVAAARLAGALFTRFGMPAVIGEVLAGILLGPSVLGALAPGLSLFLFPPGTLRFLKLFAEIGVLLFMFTVGLELDLDQLRGRAHTAVVISHASIVAPYFLGVALSLFLYRSLAPPGVSFVSFALFMGIAMSITAFPVLARILEERGLTRTFLGSTALTCAAVDDVTAWSLLAVVVAIVGSQVPGAGGGAKVDLSSAGVSIGIAVVFTLAMIRLVRPAARRLLGRSADRNPPGKTVIAGVLLVVLSSAWVTEVIGVHALFGAFLAGVVMPRAPVFRRALVERTEELASVLLLPLFFAFTGLRTQIGLLDDVESWLICLLVIVVATVGKLGASMLAARLSGMETWDAFALGALMNTRGLMELIALNVGYELGILSPRIFAMMVLMALVTTFATGPLLTLADRLRRRARSAPTGLDTLAPTS